MKRKRETSANSIWNKEGFLMCGLGEKLQTEEELEENRKRGGGRTMHFMDELPEYKGISDLYFAEEKKIEVYRNTSKDEALNMLKEYFFCLWD